MLLSVGDKLGPYEIVALIGAGGMGEVYRARDSRIGRDVALDFTEVRSLGMARASRTWSSPHGRAQRCGAPGSG